MNPTLLIVDDEDILPDLIQDYLEDETEFMVRQAPSGEEGLELMDTIRPDICMVDIRLPGMNGNEFILNALKKIPGCKFIIHTGSIDYTIPPELQEIGITQQSILFKPVTGLHLYLEKITELLPMQSK
jgi:DNA-binding NarL/FixJ family response regulator